VPKELKLNLSEHKKKQPIKPLLENVQEEVPHEFPVADSTYLNAEI
jgi:hypothetical protein